MDNHKLNELLVSLSEAAYAKNETEVQERLFELGYINSNKRAIADEVIDKIINLLKNGSFHDQKISAHLLNFFEFEAPYLTTNQKKSVNLFLREYGSLFTDVHTAQVVSELLSGDYLA